MKMIIIASIILSAIIITSCQPNSNYQDCKKDCVSIYGNCSWTDFTKNGCYLKQDDKEITEICLNKCINNPQERTYSEKRCYQYNNKTFEEITCTKIKW